MSQITTPTKDQILKAAECATPKEALEMLFPEVFEEEITEDINLYEKEGIGGRDLFLEHGNAETSMIALRDGKSFYLSNRFEWQLINNVGFETLVPIKKIKK